MKSSAISRASVGMPSRVLAEVIDGFPDAIVAAVQPVVARSLLKQELGVLAASALSMKFMEGQVQPLPMLPGPTATWGRDDHQLPTFTEVASESRLIAPQDRDIHIGVVARLPPDCQIDGPPARDPPWDIEAGKKCEDPPRYPEG